MNSNKLKVGLVQQRWYENRAEHQDNLAAGIMDAAKQGAELVCLQEFRWIITCAERLTC